MHVSSGDAEYLIERTQRSGHGSLGTNRRNVAQEERELIATQPRQHIGCAANAFQAHGHELEQFVPGLMPQQIVHSFEAVEIDKSHGEASLVAQAFAQRQLKLRHIAPPVGQAGKKVVRGVKLQFFLGLYPGSYVQCNSSQKVRAGGSLERKFQHQKMALGAIHAAQGFSHLDAAAQAKHFLVAMGEPGLIEWATPVSSFE